MTGAGSSTLVNVKVFQVIIAVTLADWIIKYFKMEIQNTSNMNYDKGLYIITFCC